MAMSPTLLKPVDDAAASFKPSDIAGLNLWLRPNIGLWQDTAGTVPAVLDADPVARWDDQSGQGNNPTQATAGKRPLLKLAIQNNQPVVRFDGASQFLQKVGFAGGNLAQPFTVFIVFKVRTVVAAKPIFRGGNDGASDVEFLMRGGTSNWGMIGSSVQDLGASDTNWHITSLEYNGASSKYRFDGNTEATTAGTVGTAALNGLTLAANSAGTLFGTIDVGEVAIYSGSLSAANKVSMFSYLNAEFATY